MTLTSSGQSREFNTEMPSRGPEIQAWSIPAAKLLDFTARTHIPGPSKL